MATKKISELLQLETVSANLELTILPVLDTTTGITKKVTLQQLNDSIEANIPFAAAAFTQANTGVVNAATADQKALSAGNYANSAFLRANNSLNVSVGGTITGDVSITGNLAITGCTATLSVSTLRTSDHILDVGFGTTGSPSQNAGIRVLRGDEPAVQIRWNEDSDNWQYTNDGATYLDFSSADANKLDSSYNQANTATTDAATADQRAVTSGDYANSAYVAANTADTYVATNAGIWDTSSPTTIQSAVDRLANAIYALNSNTPIP